MVRSPIGANVQYPSIIFLFASKARTLTGLKLISNLLPDRKLISEMGQTRKNST
jgi:hypothetical protein